MILKNLISKYTSYNHWANKEITQWLKTLDQNILYKETLSSFTSIDLTLQHMKNAQYFWLAVLAETDFRNLDETIKVNASDFVINDLLAGSQLMIDIFTLYTEEELLKQVSNAATTQSRYDFILHVINHNSYHRGQVVTMSRTHGVRSNIPNMDYEYYLWSQH